MTKFIKSYGALIVLALVFVGTIVYSSVKIGELQKAKNNIVMQVESLETKIKAKDAYVKKTLQEALEKTTGLNQTRVDKDSIIIKKLAEDITNWKSYKEYNKVRTKVMDKYNLKENSNFMTVFLPKIANERMQGKDYNKIDIGGYSVQFSDVKTYAVGFTANAYNYFSIVTLNVKATNGGETTAYVVLRSTVNDEGVISNIDAYPIAL